MAVYWQQGAPEAPVLPPVKAGAPAGHISTVVATLRGIGSGPPVFLHLDLRRR
jgi:hypothetical protein